MKTSMKRLLPVVLLLPALSAFAQTAEAHWCGLPQPHPLDAAFALAIEHSGGVTADMRDAQGEAYAGWDAELNRLYREVMKQLDGDVRATALRQAQRAWLAWDEAEAASDIAFAEDQGTSGPLGVADQAIARRRARACTLYLRLDSPASP
jgi:uncharacterized protein YecT (DUF1311 family)